MPIFNIKINGENEQYFRTKSTIYRNAAAAVPAMLDVALPCDIEIWSESLVPEYGPYHYRVREDEFGRLVVETTLVEGSSKN